MSNGYYFEGEGEGVGVGSLPGVVGVVVVSVGAGGLVVSPGTVS